MQLSDSLHIDSIDYACQGNAILGIRESGKTYTATYIAERLMDDGIPFVVFDPIGVWRYLKQGLNGPGYPVVVAGDKADLPLTRESAPAIVRAAMSENVSLVVDLYSMKLSKKDWRHIVEESIRLLQYENKEHGLRHIFIEEAAEFVPQRVLPEYGGVYAEIEKLSRMGGNASLGYTLINQRAEEVSKAVLENCDCLILHRQKGKNSLNALKKWLEITDVEKGPEIIKSLPSLQKGECWVWGEGSHEPVLIKVPEKKTVHPNRKQPLKTPAGITSDVSSFVDRMETWLVAQTAKNAQPAALGKAARVIDESDARKHYEQVLASNAIEIRRLNDELIQRNEEIGRLRKTLDDIGSMVQGAIANEELTWPAQKELRANVLRHKAPVAIPEGPAMGMIATNGNGALPSGELKILTACAQYPNGLNRQQLSVITAFAKSTRDRYIQRLGEKRLLEIVDGKVRPTKDGKKVLGKEFKPLPTGVALQKFWVETLPEGESRILGILIDSYPNSISREHLAHRTGYAKSTRDRYIQRLVAKEIAKPLDRGMVQASENLFN